MAEYKVLSHPDMGYAVFRRCLTPSGTTAFWQQVTKWYFYEAWAIKYLKKLGG